MERLQPFFPRSHGKPRVDDRRVLSGIVFVRVALARRLAVIMHAMLRGGTLFEA